MTAERISTGLLEAFSHTCENCQGRGVLIESDPIEPQAQENRLKRGGSGSGSTRRSGSRRRGKSGGRDTTDNDKAQSDGSATDRSQPSDETQSSERTESESEPVPV